VAQSRKDLFQAHRLMTQRASLALLRGEPDLPDQPLRRLNVAVLSSVLVAVIVAAGGAVWTVLGHGGGPPSLSTGTLIVDSETNTPYVFCGKSGKLLCPVVNYASARLALGNAQVTQQTVTQEELTRYPRGPLIGIPGLPQPLPAPGLLARGPWSVCTRQVLGTAGPHPVTVLAAGVQTGGRVLPLTEGLLLEVNGQDWLAWNGERLAVKGVGLQALNTTRRAVPASPAWLNALPQGPQLAPPQIPGSGQPAVRPARPGAKIGQVFKVSLASGMLVYYVQLSDGLAKVTPAQATLLGVVSPGGTVQLSPPQIRGHVSKTVSLPPHGLPSPLPVIVNASTTTLCDVYPQVKPDAKLKAEITVGGTMPSGGVPTGGADVSQIVLRPQGAGALVGIAPAGGASGSVNGYFLVSGGRRYGLAAKSVVPMLGYSLATDTDRLPASVVDLIPASQAAFDPALAKRTVPQGAGGTGRAGAGSSSQAG
jgi:ESX secretion system ATPase EccB